MGDVGIAERRDMLGAEARDDLHHHISHARLSTNLPALQEGAVPVMFALLDARSMTCG
jgi:hypothetical protein